MTENLNYNLQNRNYEIKNQKLMKIQNHEIKSQIMTFKVIIMRYEYHVNLDFLNGIISIQHVIIMIY